MNIPTSPALFPWKPTAWLRVTGSDAPGFLQGQFTNDLRDILPNQAVYGLRLNVKGRVIADSFVIRGEATNEFWVGSYFSAAVTIRERLESFVVADDVVVEDATSEWSAVTLLGPGALAPAVRGGLVFPGRRGSEANTEWVFPATETAAVQALLAGVREVDHDAMARRRIEAGIPAVPADVGPGDLPNEGGLEDVTISYTKGCYLGQEVIARLKSMGQVRRRLVQVAGAGAEIPRLPAALFLGARQVGELRSAVGDGAGGWIGLAMLSLLHIDGNAMLAFAPDAAPKVRLVAKP